jgi:diacylglycerol kinase (ATP)
LGNEKRTPDFFSPAMKLIIIANPIAGRGRAYRALQRHLLGGSHPGWEIELLTTRGPEDAGLLVQGLLAHPPDLLGICGGDGTVNEIASVVPDPPFPIAILPAGTANVVARELGVPLNPVRALRMALIATVRHIDLGELDGGRRRFLFVAGAGFDAYVVASAKPKLKKKFGMAAYAATTVDCLRHYSFPEFQATVNGKSFTTISCLACNGKSYGGGLLFCPAAVMNDGLLDFLILERRGRLELAGFLLKAWLGIAATGDWIHRLRADSLQIEGDSRVLVQVDGECAGTAPLEIGLRKNIFPLKVAG